MKVYLAAPFSMAHQVEAQYARDLARRGLPVVSQWHRLPHSTDLSRAARRDLEDILEADTFILLANLRPRANRGGRHVEFGFALARDKRIMVVGARQNLFHYLPNVEVYPAWGLCLDALCSQTR